MVALKNIHGKHLDFHCRRTSVVEKKKKRKEKKGEEAQLFGIKIIKFFYIYIIYDNELRFFILKLYLLFVIINFWNIIKKISKEIIQMLEKVMIFKMDNFTFLFEIMRYVSPFVHALCFCCMGRVVNNGETLASFKISFLFTELLFSIIPLLILRGKKSYFNLNQ